MGLAISFSSTVKEKVMSDSCVCIFITMGEIESSEFGSEMDAKCFILFILFYI